MDAFICVTCGTQYPPAAEPPAECPICLDERQYVGHDGQCWTTMAALGRDHRNRLEQLEPGLVGVGTDPAFAIGQRALLVAGLVWDCITLIDADTTAAVQAAGGVHTIAISHPHYYTAMVEWAERLDARVLLHEADSRWVMRPSPRIEFWSGERIDVGDGLALLRLGGHFEGGTVCLWRNGAEGRGALLSGDIVQVVADRAWVSFMRSYPNLIPLAGAEVARIRDILVPLEFDRVYGAFWGAVIPDDAHAKVLRSADRYVRAVGAGQPPRV
jgi:hypothetical protein